MAGKPAPHAHRVQVREKSTGRVFDAWPVDAREMVSHPESLYELVTESAAPADTTTTPAAPAAPPSPAPVLPIAEQLTGWGYKDLQTLAKRAGVNANQKAAELVAALVPHVEARTVSLEQLPPLVITPAQFPNAQES